MGIRKYMKQGSIEEFEAFLGCLSVGVLVLDSTDLRIRYLNSYLNTQIEHYWPMREVMGQHVAEFLPEHRRENVLTRLRALTVSEEPVEYAELAYEGLLYTRGRTYWHVTLKRVHELFGMDESLLILIEDVTGKVRSRLYVNALNAISSAIVGTYALPLVLDRILHGVHELIGATRCAIFLVEHSVSGNDNSSVALFPQRATMAAQQGIHSSLQDWRPLINERLLLGRVKQLHHTLLIPNTATVSALDLPFLDDSGVPRRPGSVLCIPIYGQYALEESPAPLLTSHTHSANKKTVLGSIEVYHRRARSFAQEEVALLEQFAQQAGQAIQNARLFRMSSELIRAERRSAHQREYMMQAIPDGVIIFDPRWRVAEINQAIRVLLGWSETIIGQSIVQAFQQSTATLAYDILHLADPVAELERRTHAGFVDEFKMIGANGQAYSIHCTYTPIRDDLGDTFAFVVIFHDVTEQTIVRERIEVEVIERTKELAQRNETLKALEQAREDFFTSVAHELKTPLANMRAHLSALLAHDIEWSRMEQHTALLIADEQAERLVQMVNSILDASRVEAGALQLDLEAVLLPELFEDLEERLEALIAASKRHLRITYPAPLPAVRADYERIISVLTNLLSNAFRYAPEGETVVLAAEPIFAQEDSDQIHPLGVQLYVSDTGPGMSQEQQKQLFRRFSTFAAMNTQKEAEQTGKEQRQVSSRWSSATGLGLYISRGIVEAHGSTLTLQSEPGQGASFSFTLPTYEAFQHSRYESNLQIDRKNDVEQR